MQTWKISDGYKLVVEMRWTGKWTKYTSNSLDLKTSRGDDRLYRRDFRKKHFKKLVTNCTELLKKHLACLDTEKKPKQTKNSTVLKPKMRMRKENFKNILTSGHTKRSEGKKTNKTNGINLFSWD